MLSVILLAISQVHSNLEHLKLEKPSSEVIREPWYVQNATSSRLDTIEDEKTAKYEKRWHCGAH